MTIYPLSEYVLGIECIYEASSIFKALKLWKSSTLYEKI